MLRFPISFALAIPMTAALFLLLHALISMRGEAGEGTQVVKIEFSRLRPELDAVEPRKYEKPERESRPEKPPPPGLLAAKNLDPDETMADLLANVDPGIDLGGAPVLGGGGGGGGGGGSKRDPAAERDALPLVRVDPEYPERARQQGLGGYVIVEFTVSPAGTVKDPRVIEAEPRLVFEESVLRAVRRWRYNPKVENGVAVARLVQTRLTFKPPGSR